MRPRLMLAAVLAAPSLLAAQVPGSSARAVGMGGAYSALAQGYEAVGWNPAMLASSHQSGLSIGLPQGRFELGNNAFSISDFRTYADKDLSDADKQYLLGRVVNDDSTWAVRGNVGVQGLGVSVGHFAVTLSASAGLTASANRDAVDFALNGNGAFSTPGNFFNLAGSGGNGWGATTLAGSYAMTLPTGIGRLAIGGTIKRVWGNFQGVARDNGSQVSPDTIAAVGQSLYTDYSDFSSVDVFGGAAGHGWGLDVGATLQLNPKLLLSASIINALATMSWDIDHLRYDRASYNLTFGLNGVVSDTSSNVTLRGSAISSDAQAHALLDTLNLNNKFSRVAHLGAAYRVAGFTLGGDLRLRLKRGMDEPYDKVLSAGAEYVVLGFLPLRAGIATDFDHNTGISGGLGLRLGPVHIDAAATGIVGNTRPGVVTALGLGLFF